MIQELLGGGSSLLGGSERKISFNGAILEGTPTPCPPTNTTSTTTTTTTTATITTNSDQQNLRCPRCDSSNTKFCYYNNYNLTQPRHFCKTCRRYWTKGGALRNVPIGGGCRKNKSSTITPTTTATTAKASSIGKVKTSMTDIMGKSSSFGFDHDPNSNPILWASPQNSQLLALLRASSQNPNPNPNPNSVMIKEEGPMIGSHMTSSDLSVGSGALNARPLSLDPLSQFPVGLCSSFWKNNQNQQPQHHHQQHHHSQNQNQNHYNNQNQNQNQNQHGGLLMGDVQNNGIQELYQRLRSSVNYYSDHNPTTAALSNVVSDTPTSSSSIMEPSPIAASELNYWNPTFSWSNLSTTHGAFP